MDVKVCHFTTVHSIDDVRIFTKECTSLANNGFDVTIIACGDIAFEDNKSGVKRILLKVPVKNRLNRFFKRSKAVYKKALEIDADIYHFHDPELIPTGLKLKKKGRKVIFDSHENTTQLIKSKYWIPKLLRNFISYAYMNYEKYAIRRFDAVISVTPSIVDKFKKITNSSYQITNYPNIFNNENLDKIEKSNIAFAGTISSSYMFENVLDALDEIKEGKLMLAGPVSENYLGMLKQREGWSKVEYLGIISKEEVDELYNKSAIGIACHDYNINTRFKEGSLGVLKLFEYMNLGMAVIVTDFVLWKNIIDKYKCGISVNPRNYQEIRDAIQYLLDNPNIALEMGENGRKAVKMEYNWQTEEEKLINIYKKIIS